MRDVRSGKMCARCAEMRGRSPSAEMRRAAAEMRAAASTAGMTATAAWMSTTSAAGLCGQGCAGGRTEHEADDPRARRKPPSSGKTSIPLIGHSGRHGMIGDISHWIVLVRVTANATSPCLFPPLRNCDAAMHSARRSATRALTTIGQLELCRDRHADLTDRLSASTPSPKNHNREVTTVGHRDTRLIFTHAWGMVIAARFCVWSRILGAYSSGFAAVRALAHADVLRGSWVRRSVHSLTKTRAPLSMLALRQISGLTLGLALTSCAIGPEYSREPAPVPVEFKETKGWKVANPNDDVARGDWWMAYRDRGLD